MNVASNGIIYGPKIEKKKRWYPEHRKGGGHKKGCAVAAQSKDKTMCESEAFEIHKIRKEFDLPCKDCKYKDTQYCRWM